MTEVMASPMLEIFPLTKTSFAPYGEVIETKDADIIAINQGTTDRFHALCEVDVYDGGGVPIISIFRGQRRTTPIDIMLVERHPLGSQAFLPLSNHDWLVVVASASEHADAPDMSSLKCFLATGQQGVNYFKGTWHHPLLVLQPIQEFVVVDRQGGGHNLDEFWVERPAARIDISALPSH